MAEDPIWENSLDFRPLPLKREKDREGEGKPDMKRISLPRSVWRMYFENQQYATPPFFPK